MSRFPELPVIDRCHSYQIRTKYSYVCEKCGYQIGNIYTCIQEEEGGGVIKKHFSISIQLDQ